MGYSIEVDGTNFDSEVIEKSYLNTVILDFYALWCGREHLTYAMSINAYSSQKLENPELDYKEK